MIIEFDGLEENKKNFCNQVYFEAKTFCEKGGFSVEFKKTVKSKTNDQLRGYWRICTILAPFVQESYGEICDKDFVSDMAKLSAGYSQKIGKQLVPKSLKKAKIGDMNILIEKLYEICEHFEMKDYELTPSESRSMKDYYKDDLGFNNKNK
jgi:hypothetical protein